MMVKVYEKWASKIDTNRQHKKIQNLFPKFADRARDLIIKCLGEDDPELLKIYIGEQDDPFPEYSKGTPGVSVERSCLYLKQWELCFQMIKVDKENLDHLWSESAWEWYTRRLLGMRFKAIQSEDEYSSELGIHSEEFRKSIFILPE